MPPYKRKYSLAIICQRYLHAETNNRIRKDWRNERVKTITPRITTGKFQKPVAGPVCVNPTSFFAPLGHFMLQLS